MLRVNFVAYEDFYSFKKRLFFSSLNYSSCIIELDYLASKSHTISHMFKDFDYIVCEVFYNSTIKNASNKRFNLTKFFKNK